MVKFAKKEEKIGRRREFGKRLDCCSGIVKVSIFDRGILLEQSIIHVRAKQIEIVLILS